MSWFRYWRALLALFVVFSAGMLIGAVGTVRYIQREYRGKMDSTQWVPRTTAWLRDAASLTPEQEKQVEPIVVAAIEQMKELRDKSETQRQAIVKELLIAVAVILPEDQKQRLIQAAKEAQSKSATRTREIDSELKP